MLNVSSESRSCDAPTIYADTLVKTIKIAMKKFRDANAMGQLIRNIDVVVDACGHNTHPNFEAVICKARKEGGLFKGINRVTPLDSAASRLLQLADIVAHTRAWVINGEMTARELRQVYGIEMP